MVIFSMIFLVDLLHESESRSLEGDDDDESNLTDGGIYFFSNQLVKLQLHQLVPSQLLHAWIFFTY